MKPPSELEAPPVAPAAEAENPFVGIDQSAGDFSYDVNYEFDAGAGLSAKTIDYISAVKKEAPWIREFRHNALKVFESKPLPTHWATRDLETIDFSKIRYYLSQGQKPKRTWDEVPDDIKRTFERLGVPEQERKFLAGVEAQFDSEAAYSNIKELVAKQGVIFMNSTAALREHPDISASGSARSSRRATTNSPRSTAPCSPAARSSTCLPV
jgi:Fe-S cluster assembly protein SufB